MWKSPKILHEGQLRKVDLKKINVTGFIIVNNNHY